MTRACYLLIISVIVFLCGNAPMPKAFADVGSHVENACSVIGIRRGRCTSDDCEVLTPNGSRLTIFGGTVTRQRYIRSEAGKRLPFALAGITNKDQALEIVRARTGAVLTISKANVYDGPIKLTDGTDAILYVKLNSKGSVEEIGVTLGETG